MSKRDAQFIGCGLALLLAGAAGCMASSPNVVGSGVAASDVRQVSAFTAVALDGPFAVEIEVGPAQSVRVEGDDNIASRIVTEVSGEVLKLSTSGSFRTERPLKVVVTTPALVAVEHSGSGSMVVRGIHAERFTAGVSGSGAVELAGRADALVASVDGSGSLAATELVTISATVALSGSGSAEVHASQKVVANVSGSGSVRYTGGAQDVVKDVSGSGRVEAL